MGAAGAVDQRAVPMWTQKRRGQKCKRCAPAETVPLEWDHLICQGPMLGPGLPPLLASCQWDPHGIRWDPARPEIRPCGVGGQAAKMTTLWWMARVSRRVVRGLAAVIVAIVAVGLGARPMAAPPERMQRRRR